MQPLLSFNTQDYIYGYLLSARYQSPWVYDPSSAGLSEPDLWEILRNDDDVLTALETRRSNLVRPWRVVPSPHGTAKSAKGDVADASKRVAAIAGEALGNISMFDSARRLISDAYVIGRRYAEVEYEERWTSLDGTPEMRWYLPCRVKDVDRRRFHWVPKWSDGPGGARVKGGIGLDMFDTNERAWKPLGDDQRRRLIEYIWENTEDRLGYGRGVWEAMFYTHYFKTGSQKHLMEGLDRFANGVLKGRLDSLRAASTDLSNTQLVSNMKSELQKMRTEHVIVLGDGDDVEVMDAPTGGMSLNLEAVRYFAEKVHRLLNGSVRQAGHSVDGTGARAAAETESDTAETFYQFAREDLDAVMDRDLLGGFLYFNTGNFEALGLGQAKRPKFTSEQVRRQDPERRVAVMNQSRVPILRSEYYEGIECTPAGPDDDVIEPAAMTPPGGGFGTHATDAAIQSRSPSPFERGGVSEDPIA